MEKIINITEQLITCYEDFKENSLTNNNTRKAQKDDFYIDVFKKLKSRVENNSLLAEDFSDQLYYLQYALFRTIYDNGDYTEKSITLLDQLTTELENYIKKPNRT